MLKFYSAWLLTIEGTKWHYLHGVRDPSKISLTIG